VTFPAFKAGDPTPRGPDGGFDSHTSPPNSSFGLGLFMALMTREVGVCWYLWLQSFLWISNVILDPFGTRVVKVFKLRAHQN
jgi:hypothetical protein